MIYVYAYETRLQGQCNKVPMFLPNEINLIWLLGVQEIFYQLAAGPGHNNIEYWFCNK